MFPKIQEAIEVISRGLCNLLDVSGDIKVYRVKNIVRIDIKLEELK